MAWAQSGLLPEHLRQVLGYSSLNNVLPYLTLVGGVVGGKMDRLDKEFRSHVDL